LVDELEVWASGRTVRCEACGQQWRAEGAGVRPDGSEPAAAVPPESDGLELHDEVAEVQTGGVGAPVVETAAVPETGHAEAAEPEPVADAAEFPGEDFPGFRPIGEAPPIKMSAVTPVVEDPAFAVLRHTTRTRSAQAVFRETMRERRLWIGIAILLILTAVFAVTYRAAIVRAIPRLGSVYATVGLPPLVAPAKAVRRPVGPAS
jgi:hypothetical protein